MQKKFYLLILFTSAGFVSNAQISKGAILLGGDINYYTQTTTLPAGNAYTPQSSQIILNPVIGKAIKNNLVAGFDLYYQHGQSNQNDGAGGVDNFRNDIYGLGVFLREYTPLTARFAFFTEEGLKGSYTLSKDNGSTSNDEYEIDLGLDPGLAYMASPKVQLEISFQDLFDMNYQRLKSTSSRSSSFAVDAGLPGLQNVLLGFRFLLGS